MRKNNAQSIRRILLAGYDEGKRTLPWREESDPYRIWVSEIMLQQTRVETVVPYYQRWLARFPDLDSVAEAEEDEVLKMWQGLGYYSRARRLQEGARVVRERFGGSVPSNSEALRELPGVGEYTAGAVASIAFGEVVPAVDGNVKRVLSRLFDLVDPTPGEYQELAQDLVDPARPGDFNQALMELGAIVCIPRSPRCPECTVAPECLALERGTVAERPATKKKKPVPEVDISVLVALAEDLSGDAHLLLRKRPAKGLLAGMWEFPGVEVGSSEFEEAGFKSGAWSMALELGLVRGPGKAPPPTNLTELELVTHVFSHLKARYRPYLLRVGPEGLSDLEAAAPLPSDSTNPENPPVWIRVDELEEFPLPVAQGKIARAALEKSGL